jgi:hypothetical protein
LEMAGNAYPTKLSGRFARRGLGGGGFAGLDLGADHNVTLMPYDLMSPREQNVVICLAR